MPNVHIFTPHLPWEFFTAKHIRFTIIVYHFFGVCQVELTDFLVFSKFFAVLTEINQKSILGFCGKVTENTCSNEKNVL